MSVTKDDVQDASGRRTYYPGHGTLRGWPGRLNVDYTGSGVPTNGIQGFAPGATYQNFLGTVGTCFYINVGTFLSAVWLSIDGAISGGSGVNTVNTAITTVGAGTLTAAAIAGRLITRSGSVAAYSDATDTAAAIISALPSGSAVGTSFYLSVINTVGFYETITAGTGVTLSGITVIPPYAVGHFLVTYTGAGAVSIYGVDINPITALPPTQYTTNTTTGTFVAGQLTGAAFTVYNSTATTPGTITTRTATQMFADIPNAFTGMSWAARIINSSGSANTLTVGFDASVTQSGTTAYTAAQHAYIEFICTFTSPTAMTMKVSGAGAAATN